MIQRKYFNPILILFFYPAQAGSLPDANYDSAIDVIETSNQTDYDFFDANSITFGSESDSDKSYINDELDFYENDLPPTTEPLYEMTEYFNFDSNLTESNDTNPKTKSGIQNKALRPAYTTWSPHESKEEIVEKVEVATIVTIVAVGILLVVAIIGAGYSISRRPSGSEARSSTNREGLSRGLSFPDDVHQEDQRLVGEDDVFDNAPIQNQNKVGATQKV